MFVDRVLYGGPDEQRLALGRPRRRDRRRGARFGLRSSACCRCGSSRWSASAVERGGLVAMAGWTPATSIGGGRWPLAVFGVGLRPDGDAALHGRRRGGRASGLRDGLGHRDRGPDDRHGRRARRPDRVRLDHDRPALRPGLRDARRVPGVHPRDARGPAAPRRRSSSRRWSAGRRRGGPDHGRAVPRRGACVRPWRSLPALALGGAPDAYAGGRVRPRRARRGSDVPDRQRDGDATRDRRRRSRTEALASTRSTGPSTRHRGRRTRACAS